MRDSSRRVLIALDRDGTVVPIASRPEQAKMSARVRDTLNRLACKPNLTLCIVSARSIKFLKDDGLQSSVILAGNYGMEIAFPDGSTIVHEKAAGDSARLQEIKSEVQAYFSKEYGLIVEDHGYSFCIHWHLTPGRLQASLHDYMRNFEARVSDLRFVRGNTSYEVFPDLDWDKGKAMELINSSLESNSIDSFNLFAGDSPGDEAAYRFVNGRGGLSVNVGLERETKASLCFKSPDIVLEFLQSLVGRALTPSVIMTLADEKGQGIPRILSSESVRI